MKQIDLKEVDAERKFAEKAASFFSTNEKAEIFGDFLPDEFLALRWGIGRDCVLVIKLDARHKPTNYTQAIKRRQPSKRLT